MEVLDRACGQAAFSVFANELGETLQARKTAAKELGLALAALPEANPHGPIRTARIKCEIAALHGHTHSVLSDYFCLVSRLLYVEAAG